MITQERKDVGPEEPSAGRLRFVNFTTFSPGGPPGGMWSHPLLDFDYRHLDDWIELAALLESARFDALFWADHSGIHDTYQGSWAPAVREAMQYPIGDPLILTAALASTTRELGMVFSGNVIADHPYAFARRLSTLDHLTGGRIGWNIVTSYQSTAWRNLGHPAVASHDERYRRAQDYLEVVYKLLEGSWEDDAVVRDRAAQVFADPGRVHEIGHEGEYFTVPGIHTMEPSPQRTPFLFQAGTSEAGRDFAAANAEAIFIVPRSLSGARSVIEDMRERQVRAGRSHADLLVFTHMSVVLGVTEDDAQAKSREIDDYLTDDAALVQSSSAAGIDFSQIDLDTPIRDFSTEALQGSFRALLDAAPDKSWTFRDLAFSIARSSRFVGTPEQLADRLEEHRGVGAAGVNVGFLNGMTGARDFVEMAVPVLRQRGLLQREYAPGTLREKMFAGIPDAPVSPRLPARHPGARYRPGGSAALAR